MTNKTGPISTVRIPLKTSPQFRANTGLTAGPVSGGFDVDQKRRILEGMNERAIGDLELTIHSTSDISLDTLREVAAAAPPGVRLHVDESQLHLKSALPPSFLTLVGDLQSWLSYAKTALDWIGTAATIRVLWTSPDRIRTAASTPVHSLARVIANLRQRVDARTTLDLEIAVPDETDGARLRVSGTDAEELSLQISTFLYHLPALAEVLRAKRLDDASTLASPIQLSLNQDGSLKIYWLDPEFKEHTEVLHLPTA